VQGPQGLQGDKGDKGDKGDQGDPGPAGPNTVANGSQGAPAINFASSSSTGIFSPQNGKIALAAAGNLFLHNIGVDSTAAGVGALANNISFSGGHTAVGFRALESQTISCCNTALGSRALRQNTEGQSNVALGTSALEANIDGDGLIAVGREALLSNTAGNFNVAVGREALRNLTSGSNTTALGRQAGLNPTTATNSIFIGNPGVAGTDSNTIKIGTQGTQTSTFIAGISGVSVANSATVLINTTTGQLGTAVSSRRYKEDIQPMYDVSAALLKLRPVTFRYTEPYIEGAKPVEYGLIAEEVAEVLPDLAVFNRDGQPETVKYHLLPSFLLAAYQQQSETVRSQSETIRGQAEQIAALERRLGMLEARLARPEERQAAAQ
jgi:hypothetical protein